MKNLIGNTTDKGDVVITVTTPSGSVNLSRGDLNTKQVFSLDMYFKSQNSGNKCRGLLALFEDIATSYVENNEYFEIKIGEAKFTYALGEDKK